MTILFMCQANSVRSQLAEGLARKYMPNHKILSAGASSSHVNPTVLEVLKDIEQIDARDQMSKSVYDIDMESVELTIAVCKEGVIPQELLQKEHQVWPYSVPNGRLGTEALLEDMKRKILELNQRLG